LIGIIKNRISAGAEVRFEIIRSAAADGGIMRHKQKDRPKAVSLNIQ
jgi:hypothetical protein